MTTNPTSTPNPGAALSAGKLRGLMTLADDHGIFRMLAVDQRPPLFRALAAATGRTPEQLDYDEIAAVKTLLTRGLAPVSSAVLIDPLWTHPYALTAIPGRVGMLSTLEDHAFEVRDGERFSKAIDGWSVAKIKRSGAHGVKLLAWHRPDLRDETAAHQDAFVAAVGRACRAHDIPFVLELLIYPRLGEAPDSPAYAAAKPQRVLDSVRHFADDRFGVDLLKLEFPADLEHTREFAAGAFDGRAREPVYELEQVRGWLAELHTITNVPWVLLSAGVGAREFALNLELAFDAGASGFLAGRAVWMEAIDAYPDLEAVARNLRERARPYLQSISALAATALPWPQHPRYAGGVKLRGASPTWAATYPASELETNVETNVQTNVGTNVEIAREEPSA